MLRGQIIEEDKKLIALKKKASRVTRFFLPENRMRAHRILLGSEGPKDNILKIRPPLTIGADDIDMILAVLDDILTELI